MFKTITKYVILSTVVLLVGYDIVAYFSEENSTISVIMADWSRFYPSIAFIAGLICGHWFFPARGSADD